RLAVGHERLDLGAVERGEAREHALLAARAPEVDARVVEPGEVTPFEDALREPARIGVQLAEDAREVAEVLEAFGEDGEGAARVLRLGEELDEEAPRRLDLTARALRDADRDHGEDLLALIEVGHEGGVERDAGHAHDALVLAAGGEVARHLEERALALERKGPRLAGLVEATRHSV